MVQEEYFLSFDVMLDLLLRLHTWSFTDLSNSSSSMSKFLDQSACPRKLTNRHKHQPSREGSRVPFRKGRQTTYIGLIASGTVP